MTRRCDRYIWLVVFVLALMVLALVIASKANAQGPCCPPGECGPPGGSVSVRGPLGGGVDVRVGPGPYKWAPTAPLMPQGAWRAPTPFVPPTRPPAVAPPRAAAGWKPDCMVRLNTGQAEWSGVLVALQGQGGIIATSSHQFPDSDVPQTVATFSNGVEFRCSLLARDDEADCVLLYIGKPPVPPIAMRDAPPPGTVLRVAGFGGGRPGIDAATVIGVAAPGGTDRWVLFSFEPGAAAEPGDSGGPIIDTQGYLRGIVSGVGTGVSTTVIQALLGIGGGSVGPPPQPPQPPPAPPAPPAPHDCEVTRDEFAAAVARLDEHDQLLIESLSVHSEAIAAMQLQLDDTISTPGPPGPPGKDGANGTNGDVDRDELRAIVREEIEGAILNRPPADNTFSHAVLIRDAAAEYWPRLREELMRAQGAMAGIEESDPPPFLTPLPRFVVYQDGTPIYDISGLRDVGDVLRRVSRGEFALTHEE